MNQIINSELYDLVLSAIQEKEKETYIIKEEKEIYQIYSLNYKKREPNLTYIDFGECGLKLKEINKLSSLDDILIFKIEYYSPDFKIPIIEYTLFGKFGTRKLNLLTCSDIKIMYYIPKEINNYKDYIYNPENNYYSDKCVSSATSNMTDLIVNDKKDIFNENNMSLCESICKFKGYEYNYIICECEIKIKFNSFYNVNADKYHLIYRFEQTELNILNFWVLNCYFNILTKDVITKNLCSFIILIIIFIIIFQTFIFHIKEHDMMKNKLSHLIVKIEENDHSFDDSKNIYFKNIPNKKNKIKNSSKRMDKKGKKEKIMKNNINFKNKILKSKEKFDEYEYTDNELNYLTYFEATYKDNRSFFQIYFSLIKTKQIIFFAFSCKNDFNPRTMKLSFMLSIFALFLTSNTFFINDSVLHNLFISNGKIRVLSDISKIGFSFLISVTIKNLLLLISFPEMDIAKIKNQKNYQTMQKSINMVITKCYLFFFVNIIILSLIWIYIASFFMIFRNTQMYVIKNTLISFGLSMVVPFILYIIPAFIRIISVKGDNSQCGYCFYLLAIILQVIL